MAEESLELKTSSSIQVQKTGDLHARARVGIQWLNAALTALGWGCNCIEQGNSAISLSLKKVCVDISIRKPSKIAYVTSKPGWEYKDVVVGKTPDFITPDGVMHKGQEIKKPTAKVVLASETIADPWVVQIVATDKNGDSSPPVYIPVNRENGDPAVEIARCALLTIRNLVGTENFSLKDTVHSASSLDDIQLTLPGSQNLKQSETC